MLNAQTVQSRHADVFTLLQGDLEAVATDCRPPGEAGPGSLVFVSEPAQLESVQQRGAAIVVVQRDLAPRLDSQAEIELALLNILEQVRQGRWRRASADAVRRCSRELQTGEVGRLLDEVCKRPGN
jgi:hypothetical protein